MSRVKRSVCLSVSAVVLAILTSGQSCNPVPCVGAPAATAVHPAQGTAGAMLTTVRIDGTGLAVPAVVTLVAAGQPDIVATNVAVVSILNVPVITCDLDLADAALGLRDVVVQTDCGTTVLASGFEVVSCAAPEVDMIGPDQGTANASLVDVRIMGNNFVEPVTVTLKAEGQPDIVGTNVSISGSSWLSFGLDLANAAIGPRDVVVHTNCGTTMLAGGFEVVNCPAPKVLSISPEEGTANTSLVSVQITGNNFAEPVTVILKAEGQPDIVATNVSIADSSWLTFDLDLTNAAPGLRDVVVQNTCSGDTLTGGFSVVECVTPRVWDMRPMDGSQGQTLTGVEIYGQSFATPATVRLTMPGQSDVFATNVQVLDTTRITCDLTIPGDAAMGMWSLIVHTCADALQGMTYFYVDCGDPTVASISPGWAAPGASLTNVQVTGTVFNAPASVTLTRGCVVIEATDVSVVDAATIACSLAIPTDAQSGAWDLAVRTSCSNSIKIGGFHVGEPPAVTVTGFAINNAAATTTSQTVTLNNACFGEPTEYMASEAADFAGADWQAYSTEPSFALSAGQGPKMVYFKARSVGGESGVITDRIDLGAMVIDTVPVENPGNAGEWSGESYGGYGEDRVCGAVSYPYNIGKYEVTAGQYCEFLNKVAATDTYGLYNEAMWSNTRGCRILRSGSPGSYTYNVAADWAGRPVNYVSWADAARFANWLHNGQTTGPQDPSTTEDGAYDLNGAITSAELMAVNRKAGWRWAIASEDEWYKAAYHKNNGATGDYYDYPTTGDSLPDNGLVHPTDPGNHATYYDYGGAGTGGHTIGAPYYRTEVGAHESSASPYGTFDQGGNVFEWNETAENAWCRVWRGGAFDGNIDSYLLASWHSGRSPDSEDAIVGFRVAEAPDSDGDGAPDMVDQCPDTILGAEVDADGCPLLIPGDFDRDGDVDLADLASFETCASGPAIPYSAGCEGEDLDHDGDIDQSDFAIPQRCYAGENVPVDPDCAD